MSIQEIRQVLDASLHPQILIGADQRVEVINQAARPLFGEAVEGRHFITALRQPNLLDAVERCLASQASQETRYLGKEVGRDQVYAAQVQPCARDRRMGALITLVDVSQIENVGQMRRDFVANVSHELRTPLTAIMGFIETLEGPAAKDPKAHTRFLGMMRVEADRMNRLVADLLSLSRVESEARLRPDQTVDVIEVLKACRDTLDKTARENSADINLTQMPESAPILGDREQMMQLFSNLLENGIKYGGGQIEIRATTFDHEPVLRGPGIRVDVIDHGDGINPLHIPRLTERFYRVDSDRSREKGGTGLGLAIVKHIVGRHRGRLQISSEVGTGSTFSVVLPLVGK